MVTVRLMTTRIYWFRTDFRLTDNAALAACCAASDSVLFVAVRSPIETEATRWGFPRWGAHRRAFRDQALQGLSAALAAQGAMLHVLEGEPSAVIQGLARDTGIERVDCEAIAAPEEMAEVAALRKAGLTVNEHWQSSLLEPVDLPFAIAKLPEVFTAFRQAVERADVIPASPMAVPERLPPAPQAAVSGAAVPTWTVAPPKAGVSSFPYDEAEFSGNESAGLAHLERYFGSVLPQSYKMTRNGLTGPDYSTKFSPWLAVGALSPRTIYARLKAHESRFGANESTYWIWFELLWRDFFRFWSLKHGLQLYRARGLSQLPPPRHDAKAFGRWCAGNTGHAFVDAGLRELRATGYLSNRMRQVVASYLVHDLGCDWRAGAAWFESQLIDYDVCSNQGNWLYISGRGADPRQGRRFNPDKQASDYDADGAYRALWADPIDVAAQ